MRASFIDVCNARTMFAYPVCYGIVDEKDKTLSVSLPTLFKLSFNENIG